MRITDEDIISIINSDFLDFGDYKEKILNLIKELREKLPRTFFFKRGKKTTIAPLLWFSIVQYSDLQISKTENPLLYITLNNLAEMFNCSDECIRLGYNEITKILGMEKIMKEKMREKNIKRAMDDPFSIPPTEFRNIRNKLLSESINCNVCGRNATDINLIIHHKDGNRKNNNLNNLEVICTACHFYNGHYNPNINNTKK